MFGIDSVLLDVGVVVLEVSLNVKLCARFKYDGVVGHGHVLMYCLIASWSDVCSCCSRV